MEQSLIHTDWKQLLCFAARRVLDTAAPTTAQQQLGRISLLPHQTDVIGRLEFALGKFGGALLADDVGLGKTYIALALARRLGVRTLVAAPAALREMWLRSAQRADLSLRFVSLESLGLRLSGARTPDCQLLIVDEAHNLRNRNTHRYRQVAAIASGARVLLLSATPVHNNEGELHALLALFMGARASTLNARELTLVVVRRERDHIGNDVLLPMIVDGAPPLLPAHDSTLEAILGLPPPVPPADGGDGGALVTFTLVRQWSSSHAAFARALTRRLTTGSAMLSALENGIHPEAKELRSWCASDEVIQLPLFGILQPGAGSAERAFDADALCTAVRAHLNGVRSLLAQCGAAGSAADAARADAIRIIRDAHPGEKIIAFSQFAETVRTLFRRTAPWGRSAMLTASFAAIASGRIGRQELISLFAPISNGASPPPEIRRVDVLFSTDVLSEGTNLQDASVLIHLDLPWTPVRLSQRVGRVARTGSRAAQVTVYSFPPPASAELLLRMERRLAAKLSVASRTVGVSTGILPLLHLSGGVIASPVQLDAQLRAILQGYLCADGEDGSGGGIIVSAVRCNIHEAYIAIVERDGSAALVRGSFDGARVDEGLSEVVALLRAISAAEKLGGMQAATASVHDIRHAISAVRSWSAAQSARSIAGLHSAAYARARRRLLRRIDRISLRAPNHLRARIHRMTASARQIATRAYGSGAEHLLAELAAAPMSDEAWLRAVECFGELQRLGGVGTGDEEEIRILGIFIVRRG